MASVRRRQCPAPGSAAPILPNVRSSLRETSAPPQSKNESPGRVNRPSSSANETSSAAAKPRDPSGARHPAGARELPSNGRGATRCGCVRPTRFQTPCRLAPEAPNWEGRDAELDGAGAERSCLTSPDRGARGGSPRRPSGPAVPSAPPSSSLPGLTSPRAVRAFAGLRAGAASDGLHIDKSRLFRLSGGAA
jgi:hypothetical protein